jgi:hypothetical protein
MGVKGVRGQFAGHRRTVMRHIRRKADTLGRLAEEPPGDSGTGGIERKGSGGAAAHSDGPDRIVHRPGNMRLGNGKRPEHDLQPSRALTHV